VDCALALRPFTHGKESLERRSQQRSSEGENPPAPIRRAIEIADLVLYLAPPASDFICGQVVVIDGGYSAV
jgi:NAD(P)-dependent dehydrogenase (short-subunit alcohol dehydrogenase family)